MGSPMTAPDGPVGTGTAVLAAALSILAAQPAASRGTFTTGL